MALHIEVGSDGVPFIQLGQYAFRLDTEDLDADYKERSKLELRETPEVVDDAFDHLRKLLKDEKGLKIPVEDDDFLLKFLRPCKFYPESTFRLLQRYYKFMLNHPEFSHDLMPRSIRHVYDEEVLTFIPVRSNGARIMILRGGTNWNPKIVTLTDICRAIIINVEIAMMEPKTQVGGVFVIIDLRGLALHHIWQFNPRIAKTILEFVQRCTSIRLKGIHVINQPYIFKMAYAVFKPFIGEKLRKRLHFHGYDRKSLHAMIPKEVLPEVYGGTLDCPDIPGPLFADLLSRYEKECEVNGSFGYNTVDVIEEPISETA